MRTKQLALIGGMLMLLIMSACAHGLSSDPSTPSLPDDPGSIITQAVIQEQTIPGHSLLGYFSISIDPDTAEVSVLTLRVATQHLNAMKFIEPATGGSLLTFSNAKIDGTVVDIDISLRHPFTSQFQWPGFDVKGIVIGLGDTTDPTDITRTWGGGPNSLRLLNADGWTRWWNPLEFPDNGTIWSYRDGIYGTPSGAYGYNSTLLPYKVFADALGLTDPIGNLLDIPLDHPQGRSTFPVGTTTRRHYTIDFPPDITGKPSMIFNYAVDACHAFPPDYKPGDDIEVPGGFPPDANQLEPFVVEIEEIENTLYLTQTGCVGGNLRLNINISDWQALYHQTPVSDEIESIRIISPTLFDNARSPVLVTESSGAQPWAVYEVMLEGLTPDSLSNQQILITVVSSEGDYQPDVSSYSGTAPLSTYYIYNVAVGVNAPPEANIFALNPDAPWARQGGSIHSNNLSIGFGPEDPEIAWQWYGLDLYCMPVVGPQGRIFLYEDDPDDGIVLVILGANGLPLAELVFPDFEPNGSPMMVGCSLMWTSVDGIVHRLYEDGSLGEAYEPVPSIYPSYTDLNIDDEERAFVHGSGGIQAFDQHGATLWYSVSGDEDPYAWMGTSAINRNGLVLVSRMDINSTPFVTDLLGINPGTGKELWTHSPTCAAGIISGIAADPLTGQAYYALGRHIVALGPDGWQLWEYELDHSVRETIAIGPTGTVYAAETLYGATGEIAPWSLFAYTPDGVEEWSYPCDLPVVAGPIVDAAGFIYIVANLVGTDITVALSFYPDGSVRWERELSGEAVYMTMGPQNSVLIGFSETQGTTRVLSLKDPV